MKTMKIFLFAFAAYNAAQALVLSRDDPSKDRLSADCKEPSGSEYETYAGAFGPEKIFCCETANQVLAKLENRCGQECTDSHPCNKAMKETHCPPAIEEYKAKKEEACKPRPQHCVDHTKEDPCLAHGDGKFGTSKETCEWYKEKCQEKPNKCPDHSEEERCVAHGDGNACEWVEDKCVEWKPKKCPDHSEEKPCVAHGDGNECEWYEEKCQEKPKKCPDHSEEKRCVAHGDGKACEWAEDKCVEWKPKKCPDHSEEKPCVAHGDGDECEWAEDQCREKPETCSDNTEEKPCLAHGDGNTCKWDGKVCQKDSLAWCYKMCGEVAQPSDECKNNDACKQFCTEAAKKFSAKN